MGATSIAIGFLHPGDTAGCFTESLALTQLADRRLGRIRSIIGMQSSPRLVEARSQMVDSFLTLRNEWLLMIDADMAWSPDDFELIAKHADPDDVPILGGLCFGGGRSAFGQTSEIFPTLYSLSQDEAGNLEARTVRDYPKDTLVKVDATGAAFLMVHRKVFTTMRKHPSLATTPDGHPNPHPWFGEVYHRGRSLGEDVTFCVRAAGCGFPTHVHTGARIGHRKHQYLTEQLYDQLRGAQ